MRHLRVGVLAIALIALALVVVGIPAPARGDVVVIVKTASPADGSDAAIRTAKVLALARALEEAHALGLTRAAPALVVAHRDRVTVQIVASDEADLVPGALVLDLTEGRPSRSVDVKQ